MKMKFFVVFSVVVLCLFSFVFANGISYSRISNVQTQLLESLLNKQLPNGVFVLDTFPLNSSQQVFPTVLSLAALRQCGFPVNTPVFQKGIQFLLNNYDPFSSFGYISLASALELQGRVPVKLSTCAQLVKDSACSNYLNDIIFLANSAKVMTSKKRNVVLLSLSTIMEIIKNSTKAELASWLNPNAKDKNEAFVSSMASLYDAISKILTRYYNGKNGSWVLAYMTQLDKCILNAYGEKVKEEMFDYGISDILSSPLAEKVKKDTISLQLKNGSWNWETGLLAMGIPTPTSVSSATKRIMALQTTAENVDSLLESGVPATSETVKKGISFLLDNLPNAIHEKGNTLVSYEVVQFFTVLNLYSQKTYGKGYDFDSLPSKYIKKVKMDTKTFSMLMNELYMGLIKQYISDDIFQKLLENK